MVRLENGTAWVEIEVKNVYLDAGYDDDLDEQVVAWEVVVRDAVISVTP